MAHTVYACPNCDSVLQWVLTQRSAQSFRPKERIICRDCLAEFPWQDAVIRKSATMLRGLGGQGAAGLGLPAPALVGSGSFYDESGATTSVTVNNVTVAAGQKLVVWHAAHASTSVFPISSTWNSLSADVTIAVPNVPLTQVGVECWNVSAGATSNVVVTFGGNTPTSGVVLVYALTGLGVLAGLEMASTTSSGFGTSTTPASSSDNAPTVANQFYFAGLATAGPQADSAGAWTDGFVALDRLGTAGATAGLNSTLATAIKQTPVGLVNVGKTDITSREWAIEAMQFKA